jgi:hypothetical protein
LLGFLNKYQGMEEEIQSFEGPRVQENGANGGAADDDGGNSGSNKTSLLEQMSGQKGSADFMVGGDEVNPPDSPSRASMLGTSAPRSREERLEVGQTYGTMFDTLF